MVIYRCDCCKKDVSEKSDLFRVTLYTERYDSRKDFLCFMPHLSRIEKEVCIDCMHDIRAKFYNIFTDNEVQTNE